MGIQKFQVFLIFFQVAKFYQAATLARVQARRELADAEEALAASTLALSASNPTIANNDTSKNVILHTNTILSPNSTATKSGMCVGVMYVYMHKYVKFNELI